jgi:hypothetical protein
MRREEDSKRGIRLAGEKEKKNEMVPDKWL